MQTLDMQNSEDIVMGNMANLVLTFWRRHTSSPWMAWCQDLHSMASCCKLLCMIMAVGSPATVANMF